MMVFPVREGGIFEFDLTLCLMVRDVADILLITSPLPFGGRTALPGTLVLPAYLELALVLALLVSCIFVTAVVD